MSEYRLVRIKRCWLPEWLFAFAVRLFGPHRTAKQPFRWLLTEEPDELTRWRVNGDNEP